MESDETSNGYGPLLVENDATTGGLRVAQFTANQKPFLVDFFVPIASHGKTELTFIFELQKRQRTFENQASTFSLTIS